MSFPLGPIACLALATVSQFYMSLLSLPFCLACASPSGVGIEYRDLRLPSAEFYPWVMGYAPPFDLTEWPSLYGRNYGQGLFLPWWLLLGTTLLIATILWRATRRRIDPAETYPVTFPISPMSAS